jgi:hypothetical protein
MITDGNVRPEAAAAERLREAIWRALESGALVIGEDGCPQGGTRAAAKAIVASV